MQSCDGYDFDCEHVDEDEDEDAPEDEDQICETRFFIDGERYDHFLVPDTLERRLTVTRSGHANDSELPLEYGISLEQRQRELSLSGPSCSLTVPNP